MRERTGYTATGLKDALDRNERTIAWLARKCEVSNTLMYYIVHGDRTAKREVVQRAADALGEDVFLLFDFTDENIVIPQENVA